jgi:hypothetical protein
LKTSQRVFHKPALEPLSLFTVEFITPDYKNHPSAKETRMIAGTDEVDVAKAARRYFAVENITGITRQGNVYITGR